jgi:phosphoglycerol transferase MdoB-like AlkP superfamily enzyme
MVQCESFFDARRLHPAIPRDLLPVFDECARSGVQAGQFGVSGWGAYTVRAEFAALTGLTEAALGYDRWNPYHAFVRVPIPSLAGRLRAEGYRTVCLHPFDRTYYRRHKVLPRLGFDAFIGEEAFRGARRVGGFITDEELARRAVEILDAEGRGLFLFVITMENHGPWSGEDPRAGLPDPAPDLPDFPGRHELRTFLNGVRATDAMLGRVRDALRGGPGGMMVAYGDHLPSLPGVFAACGFNRADTDYAIWDAREALQSSPGRLGLRRDLAAYELPAAVWAAHAAGI